MWADLTTLVPGLDWTAALVYLRVQGCILSFPGLGERLIPVRVRVSVALAITPLLAQFAAATDPPTALVSLIGGVVSEMAIGLAIGGLLRLMAMSIDIAASAIAATTSLSQIVGGQNEAAPHPIGNLLHLGGMAILMALGLPVMLIHLLADSFTIWPPGGLPDPDALMSEAVRVLAYSFWLAMLLAAPFTLGGFMFQALSGVINRVMPALPVVFIGSPLAILLALAALAILAPMMIDLWSEAVLNYTLPRPQ